MFIFVQEVLSVLSFGNDNIYPFPAVQYIPLAITNIQTGSIETINPHDFQPQLLVGKEIEARRSNLNQDLGIKLPSLNSPDIFPLLALNLIIDDIKYRGFQTVMTGKLNSGSYQLISVPRRFFYKKQLFFELFDPNNSQPLAHTSTSL